MYEENFITDDFEPSRKIQYMFPMLFKPCKELEPYVSCYWYAGFSGTIEEAEKLRPKTTVLIPDGGTGLVFNVNPAENWDRSTVWGVMDTPVKVYNQQSISKGRIRTFGVDFTPAGLSRFCNIPMNEYKNMSCDLIQASERIFYDINLRIINSSSLGELIQITEEFLLSRLAKADDIHSSVTEALNMIYGTGGNIRVKELSTSLIISERSLNRIFHKYIGLPPKTLCRIVRLNNVLKLCKNDNHIDFLLAAYNNGYFDQAHFIKDFKEFCGCTPKNFFKKS